ncbi:helix-turn-helix domain-containing protein [Erythrobacter sp. SCSIO 43205]|uniref:helix-turn-helix domain-containing protein n=1 Tax=Erythrobacter sp. SCSIO 43205 TaxID=2779361 RepID=UPI001CA8E79E|nr:helix-turn-helix domain-containing protein [Erythrobacter sp. SCSIO 43205]UAB77006.1 helix-turn-helix domain-containing protein [Erythrobacter sp. SCSIO 43205]
MTAPATFTVASLSERWECSEGTVRNMIKREQLASFRIGALIRIPSKEVERVECQHTQCSGFETGSLSSGKTTANDDEDGCTPTIGRARKPRLDNFGKPQTIDLGQSND